jgi:tetratricopeptide (TPR) repeat protein
VSESLELAKSRYQSGKIAMENGQYQRAVDCLEKASALLARNTSFGGEVDIWLVTAYEAKGLTKEAIALCQELTRHPDYETRQQAKQLVYILQAPKLKRPQEWMTEIPDLDGSAVNKPKAVIIKPQKSPLPPITSEAEYVDLSQVNQDNRFIWIALTVLGLTVVTLI